MLDLACGTGDLPGWRAAAGARRVFGLDLTPRMLVLARARERRDRTMSPATWARCPCAASAVDVVTTGYGLRNVPDLDAAIREVARVLRPGGRFLSLDFNRPESTRAPRVLPGVPDRRRQRCWAGCLHGDPDTYRYIPASIRRYPGAEGVAARLSAHGFTDVRVVPLLFGLMTLHCASRCRLRLYRLARPSGR